MSTHTEQALREALAFDPQTPALAAEPIIEAVQRGHRRSMWIGAIAASVALTAGGFAFDAFSGRANEQVHAIPAGVAQASGAFDIGHDWQMVVDGQGLCLTNPDRSDYSCGVDLAFREGSTFSWSDGTSGAQIYAWVVRDNTATASLEKPTADMIPAQVYRVSELDVSIAVAHLLPEDLTGWERISRDEVGTVTDSVPFHVEDGSIPTQG